MFQRINKLSDIPDILEIYEINHDNYDGVGTHVELDHVNNHFEITLHDAERELNFKAEDSQDVLTDFVLYLDEELIKKDNYSLKFFPVSFVNGVFQFFVEVK